MSASNQRTPLVTHIYTADPSAHVFEGKLYIYPSHDLEHDGPDNDNGDQYAMEDYHVLSMDNVDSPCVDHGQVLHMKDVPWVGSQMWAPDAAHKNGKYYLYFPAKDKDGIFRIGVAVSDKPAGQFKAEPSYIPGSYSIDPAVFVDDDGKAYMYIGGLWGGQLEKWQTGKYQPDAKGPSGNEPALGPVYAELTDDMLTFKHDLKELQILDENGKPLTAGDEDRRFFEAPWIHKYNGEYYLSYSTGSTHYLVYATSKSPTGPFTYRGRILEPVVGWTTHQSIVEFQDKWYLFYHDSSLSGGINHNRCVKFQEIKYNPDGTIQTVLP
jgi:beta-xylosidase